MPGPRKLIQQLNDIEYKRDIMMKKNLWVCVLGCTVLSQAFAGDDTTITDSAAQPQSFAEALSEAYGNNPDVQAGLRKYYAAVEAIPAARAGWLPTVNLTTTGQHKKSLANANTTGVQPTPRIHSNTANDSLSVQTDLQQNVFNGFGTMFNVESAQASVKAAEMAFVDVEQKVLLDSAKAYLDLWKAYETLRYRKASVGFRRQVVEQVTAQETVGEKTRADVAEAESRLAAAISDRLTAEASVTASRATYEQVISEDVPDTLKKPDLLVEKEDLPTSSEELNRQTLERSPSLQQAIQSEKSQRANVGVAESSLLPRVDVTASGSRDKTNTQTRFAAHGGATVDQTGFGYTNSGTVSAKLTVPLYQAGAKWSGVRKANQDRYQAVSIVRQTRLKVAQSAAAVWQNLKSLEESVAQDKKRVEAAKVSLEGKRQEYLVGELTLTDTLIAEQNLVDSQVQLVARQRDYQVTTYELMSLYGGLLPEALSLSIARHDIMQYTDSMSGKIFGIGNLREPVENKD